MRTSKDYENFMLDFIREVSETIGPRPACSKEEEKCAYLLQSKLDGLSDSVQIDKFYCHPGAYKASFRWPVLLYLISVPSYILLPIVSCALTLFALVILLGETAQNYEIIDFLFKKKSSTNFIAKIKPIEETKNIIIISGHHDSNVEFPLGRKYGDKINIFMSTPIFFSLFLLVISVIKIFVPLSPLISDIILGFLLATIPYFLFLYKNIISNKPVIGANDNLSALSVTLGIANYFSSKKTKLRNSELWIVSFGCEEIGIRGSKRFVCTYFNDIKNAYHINLDLVGEIGCQPYINTKEEMGLIKLSSEICNVVEDAAKKTNIPIQKGGILSFTDSMSFAKKGIKSAGIIALQPDGSMPKFYHTTNDIIDIIDPKLLRNCLEICIQVICSIDEKTLKHF